MALRSSLFVTVAMLAISAAACSSAPPSLGTFDDGDRSGKSDKSDTSATGTISDPAAPAAQSPLEACATSSASAEQLPLHLVLVLDQSGSMCETQPNRTDLRDCGDGNSKWQQVTKALNAFFASPSSKGITASLVAFPAGNYCDPGTYANPLVSSVELPDTGNKLSTRIGQLSPNGATPTRPALEGAMRFAKGVNLVMGGRGKVAVVMATDGFPQDCSNNSISSASNVAAAEKTSIPTYVIGVGTLLNDLNALAAAGGTDKAFLVSTQNQSTVGQAFSDAMTKIRGASLACEYGLPAAPAGQTLDFKKVNVQVTASGGTASTVPYSADCANAGGWRYDNAAAPTKIQLCTSSCDKVKADGTAKLDLVLGCETQSGTVR
jgi:hypothetical protein